MHAVISDTRLFAEYGDIELSGVRFMVSSSVKRWPTIPLPMIANLTLLISASDFVWIKAKNTAIPVFLIDVYQMQLNQFSLCNSLL